MYRSIIAMASITAAFAFLSPARGGIAPQPLYPVDNQTCPAGQHLVPIACTQAYPIGSCIYSCQPYGKRVPSGK